MIGEAIRALILNDPTIHQACGDKVFPSFARQSAAAPYVVFRIASRTPNSHQTGDSYSANAIVEVDIFASSYAQMESLAEALRYRVNGFRGVLGAVRVSCVMQRTRGRDVTEAPYDGGQKPVFHWYDEFSLWYQTVGV